MSILLSLWQRCHFIVNQPSHVKPCLRLLRYNKSENFDFWLAVNNFLPWKQTMIFTIEQGSLDDVLAICRALPEFDKPLTIATLEDKRSSRQHFFSPLQKITSLLKPGNCRKMQSLHKNWKIWKKIPSNSCLFFTSSRDIKKPILQT